MVDPRYLEGFLRAPEAQSAIDRMKTGINDSGLNLTHSRFLPLPVRLAPCREQVRIVEALDSYFSRLDDAEATLERAKRNLERYRASVLQAAVEGRLMGADTRSAWPEFTGLATERVYQNRMELPVGWRWARVGEIGQVKGGKRLPAGAEYSPSPTAHPYLRVCDFTDGTISHANLRFLPSAVAAALSRYTISKNDVYISIAGTIGLAGTVPEDLDGANLTENAAKICNLRSVLPKFLAIVLSSPFGQRQIAEKTIATTLSKLALYRIETVGLPLPPLVEQERITQEVERLESIQASSTGCVGKFHSRAAELRRSLLTIAFKGRLVVQDSTDEPASVLLERIRAERAKAASSHETPRHRARPRKAVKK
jgi:type I restriction enzyme S subunit